MELDIERFALVFFVLSVLALIVMWTSAAKMYGRLPIAVGCLMWRAQARSPRGVGLHAASVLALGYVLKASAFPGLAAWLPPIPIFFVLAGAISFVGYTCLPPTVLLLTSSSTAQLAFIANLKRSIQPYRVVFALVADFGPIEEHNSWDNLRCPPDVDWRQIIEPLMDVAPIVVIDTRVPSPGVLVETERLLSSARIGKAVFVTFSSGSAPALDQCIREGRYSRPEDTIRAVARVSESAVIPAINRRICRRG